MLENNELHQLKKTLEGLSERLSTINTEMDALSNKISKTHNKSLYGKLRQLSVEKNKIRRDIYSVQLSIILFGKPIKTDGVIEIRSSGINSEDFLIFLSGQRTVVGCINYRGYHDSKYFGDIGYEIYPEFRGNSYSYRALCLLGEYLNEKDIKDIWISSYKANVTSIRVIEKYGGVPLISHGSYTLYQAQTKVISREENKVMK